MKVQHTSTTEVAVAKSSGINKTDLPKLFDKESVQFSHLMNGNKTVQAEHKTNINTVLVGAYSSKEHKEYPEPIYIGDNDNSSSSLLSSKSKYLYQGKSISENIYHAEPIKIEVAFTSNISESNQFSLRLEGSANQVERVASTGEIISNTNSKAAHSVSAYDTNEKMISKTAPFEAVNKLINDIEAKSGKTIVDVEADNKSSGAPLAADKVRAEVSKNSHSIIDNKANLENKTSLENKISIENTVSHLQSKGSATIRLDRSVSETKTISLDAGRAGFNDTGLEKENSQASSIRFQISSFEKISAAIVNQGEPYVLKNTSAKNVPANNINTNNRSEILKENNHSVVSVETKSIPILAEGRGIVKSGIVENRITEKGIVEGDVVKKGTIEKSLQVDLENKKNTLITDNIKNNSGFTFRDDKLTEVLPGEILVRSEMNLDIQPNTLSDIQSHFKYRGNDAKTIVQQENTQVFKDIKVAIGKSSGVQRNVAGSEPKDLLQPNQLSFVNHQKSAFSPIHSDTKIIDNSVNQAIQHQHKGDISSQKNSKGFTEQSHFYSVSTQLVIPGQKQKNSSDSFVTHSESNLVSSSLRMLANKESVAVGVTKENDISNSFNEAGITTKLPSAQNLMPTPSGLFQEIVSQTRPNTTQFQNLSAQVVASIDINQAIRGEEMVVKLAHPSFSGAEIHFKMENNVFVMTFSSKNPEVTQLAQLFLPELKNVLEEKFPQLRHEYHVKGDIHERSERKQEDSGSKNKNLYANEDEEK